MLFNYLKIAARNLSKNKLFSFINILGMSISLTSVFIITLFVLDEFSFDKHVANYERKFRIYDYRISDNGETGNLAVVPYPMATFIQKDLPEIESIARIMSTFGDNLFEASGKQLQQADGIYAEEQLPEILSINFIAGDPLTALSKKNQVVLNKTTAEKYFGTTDVIGKPIKVSKNEFTITGVIADLPETSHLKISYMISMPTLTQNWNDFRFVNWINQQYSIYVTLKEGTDPIAFESKLQKLVEENAWPKTKPQGFHYIPQLQSLADIHLKSADFGWDIAQRGNAQTVQILSVTAALILVIACLNFVNLSTARSIKRMKEVGVRKVIGAQRLQLISQFVFESVILTLLSLGVAVALTELVLPALNAFAEKNISDPFNLTNTPLLIVGAIVIGLLAGFYPAFHLSRFRPAHILANKGGKTANVDLFRKALVVVQFAFSFFLIISAMIVIAQNDFLRNKDLGFNKEELVVIPLTRGQLHNREAIKNEYMNNGNIVSGTLSYGLPGDIVAGDGVIDAATDKPWGSSMIIADADYIPTMDMKIIAGRAFEKDSKTDEREGFILNEEAAKAFGYGSPENAIGKKINWQRWGADSLKKGEVIGVVKDFHIRNFREKIGPLVIQICPDYFYTLTLRIKPDHIAETIAHLKTTWEKNEHEWPFEYRFLDESFNKMHKNEEKLSSLLGWFTGFAILIACLGLFGLVEYSVNQRAKEISIRKVFGAGIPSLLMLLTRSYFALIAIAFAIVIPISAWAANSWLSEFAYKIDIDPMIFVQAGLLVVLITTLTVIFQSLRAASSNPASVLKNE